MLHKNLNHTNDKFFLVLTADEQFYTVKIDIGIMKC